MTEVQDRNDGDDAMMVILTEVRISGCGEIPAFAGMTEVQDRNDGDDAMAQ